MDNSCCSCRFAVYQKNRYGDSVSCGKGKHITKEMLMDTPCDEYERMIIKR